MTIYLDENLPPHLAEGFHILQFPEGLKTQRKIEVKYIPTVFGRGVKDVDWIPKAGKEEACVITQDINIHRRKHELELYRKNGIGMFFLKGPSKKKGSVSGKWWRLLQKTGPKYLRKLMQTKSRLPIPSDLGEN